MLAEHNGNIYLYVSQIALYSQNTSILCTGLIVLIFYMRFYLRYENPKTH